MEARQMANKIFGELSLPKRLSHTTTWLLTSCMRNYRCFQAFAKSSWQSNYKVLIYRSASFLLSVVWVQVGHLLPVNWNKVTKSNHNATRCGKIEICVSSLVHKFYVFLQSKWSDEPMKGLRALLLKQLKREVEQLAPNSPESKLLSQI